MDNTPAKDDPEPTTEMAPNMEVELRVLADEEYELLRLKLAELDALAEIQLLDELMLLQGAQLQLAKGEMLKPEWQQALLECFRQPTLTNRITSI